MSDASNRCQRLVDTPEGRDQCALEATWTGRLHAGREIYVVATCDRHKSGIIDAEPMDGNWERTAAQVPKASRPT